ncbi:hypothetical protein VTN77DRAFT_3004 [Rasamsonia byssochlamydoides]|uniref:uncharacterized protein n=1 Tax=Rasamsonia byssochlamydoides TaxID=89139 RepID=UPI00374303D2
MLKISKLAPQLLRRYKFTFAKPNQERKVHGGWSVVQDGLDVVVSRRTDEQETGYI